MKDGARAIRLLPRPCDQTVAVIVEPARALAIRMVLPQLDPTAGDDRAFRTSTFLEIDKAMADAIGSLLRSLLREHRSLQQDSCTQLARQTRFEDQESGGNCDTREHDEG